MSKYMQSQGLPGLLLAVLAGLALSACASKPKEFGGDPGLAVLATNILPEPTKADLIVGDRPYYIGPYDQLMLGVFGIEGLEEVPVQVDSSGQITFPIIGSVQVGGKTLSEVQQEIRLRLQENFVRDPQVMVNLRESFDRVVTVDGQVAKPGSYPVVGQMSLLRAVANAGSTTEFARLEDVVVFREVAGQRYAALYNLEAIRRGYYEDPEIFANDLVVVGDSQARRLFKDLIQIAPLLTTPLVFLLQN
jgi:polysaccharide export outer membrane protein